MNLLGKYWQNLWGWRCSEIWLLWAEMWWQFSGGRWQPGWLEKGWIFAGWWGSFQASGDESGWCYRWKREHQLLESRGQTRWSGAAEENKTHGREVSEDHCSRLVTVIKDSASTFRLNMKWLGGWWHWSFDQRWGKTSEFISELTQCICEPLGR